MISEKELAAYNEWTDNKLERLRYEYDLNESSICFDLGAFHCDWSVAISDLYNKPTIYAFEALPAIYDIGKENIQNYQNIHLFDYGLGKENGKATIGVGETDGSSTSLFIEGDSKVEVTIRSVKDVLQNLNVGIIDLMKLNVEGSEYDILDCLIDNNLQTLVKNFQIQFHKTVPDYLERYGAIRALLSKTHRLTYDYYFVWENWSLK